MSQLRREGSEKIKNLFTENGYPEKIIDKNIKIEKRKAATGNNGRRERQEREERRSEKRKKTTYIRLPFISDRVTAQVKRVARSSGLPVEVAWISDNMLKKQLVRSRLNPLPCPSGRRHCHSCHSGLKDRCATKNVVYELTCGHCGEKYIGETSRPVRLRYNEHRRNGLNGEADTPFGEHVTQHHPELIGGDDITLSVKILRLCRDEADRRISESICIREMRPKINDIPPHGNFCHEVCAMR